MNFIGRILGLALALLGAPLFLATLLACGASAGSPGNGFGATPGGAQDMGLARELIAAGVVPPASAFVTEGIFSEHDLPVGGAACSRTLCLAGAGGVAPAADGSLAGWVQVGLSSRIDPESFERPAQTLVLVVDVSGSMGWGNGPETPGEISRTLLRDVASELTAADAVALVAYGSAVTTPLPLGSADPAALERAIAGLRESGATNLEAGLRRGIEIARGARTADASRSVRIMLFTDEQPNVGATSPEAFGGMVAGAAEDDIGITVFGAGRGLGQDIFVAMSHLRGGNAFSLFTQDDVADLMEDSWPWMLVPIATDLVVSPAPSAGLAVRRGHGFPGAEAGELPVLESSTVFLSRRRGALLLELTGTPSALARGTVELDLSYLEPSGTPVEEHLVVALPAEPGFAQPGVARTTSLALLVEGMRDAAELYGRSQSDAVARMRATRDRFAADLEARPSEALAVELELADALLALMEGRAPQR